MGLFDFLFEKKHAPDAKTQAGAEKRGAPAAKPPAAPGEPQIVYRVLTMNGVNTLIPMDTYSGLENAFLQHAQKTLNADKTFSKLDSDSFAKARREKHTIAEISGINILEDPIKWLSQRTGLSRQQLLDQMGKRLFMSKGSTGYQTYGQPRQADFSVAYYFKGELPKVPEVEAPEPTPAATGGETETGKAGPEAGYTVEQACADLGKALGGGSIDEAAVKRIGQKIYDAKVPLTKHGGKRQVFQKTYGIIPAPPSPRPGGVTAPGP